MTDSVPDRTIHNGHPGGPVYPAHPGPVPGYSPAPRHRRPGRWLLLGLVAALALCAAVPAAVYLGWPLLRGTAKADDPPGMPGVALMQYMQSFAEDPDSDVGVGRLVMPAKRGELFNLRRDYLRTMRDTKRLTEHQPGQFHLCGQAAESDVIDGDRATAQLRVCMSWIDPAQSGPGFAGGGGHLRGAPRLWTAQARKDDGGWRLWSVTIPPWCGDETTSGYARCA